MPDTPQRLDDGRSIDEWTPAIARSIAAQYLAGTGRRWRHVQAAGAVFEAAESGRAEELAAITPPHRGQLNLLTLLDMSTGPDGTSVTVQVRLAEILTRYAPGSPVHRAVTRSRAELLASYGRADAALARTTDDQAARDADELPAQAVRVAT